MCKAELSAARLVMSCENCTNMKRKEIIQSTLGLHIVMKAKYGCVGFEKVDMNQQYHHKCLEGK